MSLRTLRVATVLLGMFAAGPVVAQDDPRVVPLFKANATAGQVLSYFMDRKKSVVIVLEGGVSYAGKVKSVDTAAVILTELNGKEFYDAWIPLSAIVAMEERVRMRTR